MHTYILFDEFSNAELTDERCVIHYKLKISYFRLFDEFLIFFNGYGMTKKKFLINK